MPRVQNKKPTVKKQEFVDPHAGIWALLSVVTFIVVFLAMTVQGAGYILTFVSAGVSMFLVLLLEGLLIGKVWIFEPGYVALFADKNMAPRMMILAGSFLLIFETALLLGFATDPRFDNVMLKMIAHKQCVATGKNC